MADKKIRETMQSIGADAAIKYPDHNPEDNIPKLLDWMVRFDVMQKQKRDIDDLISKGCKFAWFFTRIPVGVDAVPDLLATAQQREYHHCSVCIRQSNPLARTCFSHAPCWIIRRAYPAQ